MQPPSFVLDRAEALFERGFRERAERATKNCRLEKFDRDSMIGQIVSDLLSKYYPHCKAGDDSTPCDDCMQINNLVVDVVNEIRCLHRDGPR